MPLRRTVSYLVGVALRGRYTNSFTVWSSPVDHVHLYVLNIIHNNNHPCNYRDFVTRPLIPRLFLLARLNTIPTCCHGERLELRQVTNSLSLSVCPTSLSFSLSPLFLPPPPSLSLSLSLSLASYIIYHNFSLIHTLFSVSPRKFILKLLLILFLFQVVWIKQDERGRADITDLENKLRVNYHFPSKLYKYIISLLAVKTYVYIYIYIYVCQSFYVILCYVLKLYIISIMIY